MKQNYTHLFADGEYSREQLSYILQAGGFTVNDDTFRNLEMKENGKYEGKTFRIMDGNVLVGLSDQEANDSIFEGKFQRLADVLGQRFLSDIELTDENPWTEESRNGIAYVKARIAGIPMDYREVGGRLFNSYVQGIMKEEGIAARIYYPDMLRMHEELRRRAVKQQTTQALLESARSNEGDRQLVFIHHPVHKDQLRAIIEKCGFKTTPDTFRNLEKDKYGQYSNITFSVVGNKATVLSKEEADEYIFHPERQPLHWILGPKAISDAVVSQVHPVSGIPAEQGHGYLTCKLYGKETSPMPIGQSLMMLYEKGHTTPQEMAASIYRDAMVQHFHSVTIKVDCGSRWTDGKHVIYQGETKDDGYHYKDLTAFDEKEGICFISEANLHDYERDLNDGKEIDMNLYGDTYEDLVDYARDLALRNPEKVARHAVERASWQSAFTELEEFHNHCEPEDILTLEEEIEDMFDRYVEEHDCMPNYAEVFIEYKDGKNSQRDMIALCPDAGENADEEVVFTCETFEDFKRLATEDNGEDFVIREIYGYHAGSTDGQKHTFDDANIHDELDETIRQAEQAEERVIEVDMDMTPQQLKDVLAKEGIKLLNVLPGIDEPLPLNKENGNVSHVYLRVIYDGVIDWADEYMYRDAMQDDPNLNIESLAAMVRLQQGVADSTAKEIPWYNDLSRISDINVFRNPMNKSYVEFRMRCKIDGVQQLGRIITAQDVEDLANGADRAEMAAKVFAREMTLNNPYGQSIKTGPTR